MPFTGNALKLIAAFCMVCDHAGLLFFPESKLLRIIGRLAFPVFAFMIAEGCKYTRSKKRYFFSVFSLAVLCQAVYFIVDGSWYLSILFTFSLAILTVYALQYWKREKTFLSAVVFAGAVGTVWVLNRVLTIDYGFFGCMVPVFAAALQNTKYDRIPFHTATLGLGLLLLAGDLGGIQYYSLLALPLLLCYNGTRGKWRMKSFFYIFYPAHLAVLQLLAWIIL